ncbi:MAG: hypothetical protein B0D88_05050, partial [Candidatus Sedimenticola endophacoides]
CMEAEPFVRSLALEYPWLRLHSLELSRSAGNARRYREMAASLGQSAGAVPAFFFCGMMGTGFDHPEGVGRQLRQALIDCHAGRTVARPQAALPAGIDPRTMSLPLFTLTLAALDAFNPCAFFVLLFLLSLLVNARSRPRMLLVGGLFVLVSGGVYFLFMAAWLELFLLVGALEWVTLAAGLVALLIGALGVKDYFLYGRGPSLSLPTPARSALFRRMRALLEAGGLSALLLGTFVLALVANGYELLCTAGFPMVYTRVLTLQVADQTLYYLYLLLYNLIYVTPLLLIVLLFVLSMGRRKLSEREGRGLKLLSGVMMSGLGLMLLVAPQWLNRLFTGLALLLVAIAVTLVVRRRWP